VFLYQPTRRASTLLPNACDVDWTDLTRVLSDNVPAAAGIGAVQTAQQALGLTEDEAAALVSHAGGNTNVAAATLVGATKAANAAAAAVTDTAGGLNGVRLPIGVNVSSSRAFLGGDPGRRFLLLQNNNAAGGANLLWSVDGAIDTTNPQFYVNLAPGLGILLDQETLINPLYVGWGSGAVLGGVCLYGSISSTRATRKPPLGAPLILRDGSVAYLPYQTPFE
jgi:hypothetical protein